MGKPFNALIVGVGGQGTLLASKVLGEAARLSGFDVKQSEVHGMAQRGGSVVTHVRFGDKVYTPLVEMGQADLIIAFEKLEALRWAEYLKPGGVIVVNDLEIPPIPVILGAASYPEAVYERLEQAGISVVRINAVEAARQIGEVRAVNVLLLGVAAKIFGFDKHVWEEAIKTSVSDKSVPVNLAAFNKGWEMQGA
ncbi:MAG: indolepyruvate oxidoreductase subunit beta [Negativicutes bacterium]|nr:indolepyruvate oxidoreductase subunit beta [Negativicutes bacterium]